jgi:hypothetical protein
LPCEYDARTTLIHREIDTDCSDAYRQTVQPALNHFIGTPEELACQIYAF